MALEMERAYTGPKDESKRPLSRVGTVRQFEKLGASQFHVFQ